MEKVWEVIKRHPYAFGGAVGLVVLYIWWSTRSTAPAPQQSQYPYDVYQDPNVIGAEANLAATQSQTNAQVALGQAAIGEQGTEAQLQAGVLGQYLTDQSQAIQDQSNALLGIAQAQYGAATSIAGIETSGAEQLAQTNGQTALALQQNNNATAIQMAQINQPTAILSQITGLEALQSTNAAQVANTIFSAGTGGSGGGSGGGGQFAGSLQYWEGLFPSEETPIMQQALAGITGTSKVQWGSSGTSSYGGGRGFTQITTPGRQVTIPGYGTISWA